MSIATMALKTRALTPEDELIGSMTRERVSLLVRYTGGHKYLEVGPTAAQHWLAHMLDTDVPNNEYEALIAAFTMAANTEEIDLELWYDMANTDGNRAYLQQQADEVANNCVEALTTVLCTQLGVQA
jgi:hypothetical protein